MRSPWSTILIGLFLNHPCVPNSITDHGSKKKRWMKRSRIDNDLKLVNYNDPTSQNYRELPRSPIHMHMDIDSPSSTMILCNFQSLSQEHDVHEIDSFCDSRNHSVDTRIRVNRNFNYLTVYNGSLHMNAKDYGALVRFEFRGLCLESHEYTHVALEIMSPRVKAAKLQVNIGYEVMELRGKHVTCQGKASTIEYGSVLSVPPQVRSFQKLIIPISINNTTTIPRNNSSGTNLVRRKTIAGLYIVPEIDTELCLRKIELIRKRKCT
jgi:hypothetical protein